MTIRQAYGSVALMLVVASVAAVYPIGAMSASTRPSSEDSENMTEQRAVATAAENFYAALNAMFTGNAQQIKDLWSHADDVTYMGPNGLYLVGWEKIEQEWNSQAASKLGGHVTPQKIHFVVGTDIAVYTCIESGENIVNGEKEIVQIRASTVFRKENGTWKIIGHQTDPLGYMNNPK